MHERPPEPLTPHERALERIITAGRLAADDPAVRVAGSLIRRLASPASAQTYGVDLADYVAWCARRRPRLAPLAAERADISDYLAWLRGRRAPVGGGRPGEPGRHYAPDTLRRRLTVVRAFYREAIESRAITTPDPVGRLAIPGDAEPSEPALTADEAALLLERMATAINDPAPRRALRARRDHLAVALMIWRGFRAGSLRSLRFGNIVTIDGSPVAQVAGNGNTQLELELTADLVDLIDAWRSAAAAAGIELGPSDPVLFGLDPAGAPIRREGRLVPLAPSTLYLRVHTALAKAGHGGHRSGPHALRRTSGTLVWQATGDVYLAKEHLGHANVSTTLESYIRPAERRARRTVDRIPLPRPTGPTSSSAPPDPTAD